MSLEELGDPSNLNNYWPDSGATQHRTPRREDLYDALEGQKLGGEVAFCHVIHYSKTVKVKVSMVNDNGHPNCSRGTGMYVPSVSRHLFLITKFSTNGDRVSITKDTVTLYFGPQACPITLPLYNSVDNIWCSIQIKYYTRMT